MTVDDLVDSLRMAQDLGMGAVEVYVDTGRALDAVTEVLMHQNKDGASVRLKTLRTLFSGNGRK